MKVQNPEWPDIGLMHHEYHTEWRAWKALGPENYVWADRKMHYTADGKFSDLGPPPEMQGDWWLRDD